MIYVIEKKVEKKSDHLTQFELILFGEEDNLRDEICRFEMNCLLLI